MCLAAASLVTAQGDPSMLRVQPGFSIQPYGTAETASVPAARAMASTRRGGHTYTFVSTDGDGLYCVVDLNGTGAPDFTVKLRSGLSEATGVAWHGGFLYLAGFEGGKGVLWRLRRPHLYALRRQAYAGPRKVVTSALPGDIYHGRRFLRWLGNGLLLVGIGAPCNSCPLDTSGGVQYGSLYTVNVTSGALKQVATGVRNSVGFDVRPGSGGDVYFSDAGRDGMGDDVPDCELNRLSGAEARRGGGGAPVHFGFPYCHTLGTGVPQRRDLGPGAPVVDPDNNAGGANMDCSAPGSHRVPVQAMGPHTTPLGLRFYRWQQGAASFPRDWDGVLFIAQRGSWNRARKIGARVMALRLDAAGAPAEYAPFAWGWLQNEGQADDYYWGRPADVEQLPDGSLLVSDDTYGRLFRIQYTG